MVCRHAWIPLRHLLCAAVAAIAAAVATSAMAARPARPATVTPPAPQAASARAATAPAPVADDAAPLFRTLPPEVLATLRRAQVGADALAVVVHDATTGQRVLQWQAQRALNPASLMKLVTTAAALELLGPAWTWQTPVWLTGPVRDGVLEGQVVVRGSGDPKFTIERVWLLLRRLQQLGVREIRGDIVLDGSAFAVPEAWAGDFDGEPLRAYNVRPAALLFNFRSVAYTFVPDATASIARVQVEPALAGTPVDRSVMLSSGPCDDWRATLKPLFEPARVRFAGTYPASCAETTWLVADPQPATYEARLIEALWREMGGQLHGSVREGTAPADAKPTFEMRSPPLAELVRDINKFSNNVMAQQLFLTLALQAQPGRAATPEAARETLQRWLLERTGPLAEGEELVIDNGSGLSRHTRLSALRLAAVLRAAFDSPVMSELMSSLPISGIDGTLRRSRAAPGRAHLKTGSLRDVAGVAGYALTHSGRRYVVVAIVNHPQAAAARPAIEALVQWVLRDVPQH